jgi:hypothetical protein
VYDCPALAIGGIVEQKDIELERSTLFNVHRRRSASGHGHPGIHMNTHSCYGSTTSSLAS